MAIYMQIQGINGDVTATGYVNWIRLDSLSFGVERNIRSVEPGDQTNREESIPNFNEVTISKQMDQSSPKLFEQACMGAAQQTITITLARGGVGGALKNYMTYTLSDVLISSYSVSTNADSDPIEDLTLSYDQIQMVYIPYDKDGKPHGQMMGSYNLTTGDEK